MCVRKRDIGVWRPGIVATRVKAVRPSIGQSKGKVEWKSNKQKSKLQIKDHPI